MHFFAETNFETLEEQGLKVGAVSPMNARNNLIKPSYFIPDPWTKTSSDGSLLSRYVHQSISQAVNDNAKSRLTNKTLFSLVVSMLIAIPLKDLLSYLFLLYLVLNKYRKALFLDIVIFKFHQFLFKKKIQIFQQYFLMAVLTSSTIIFLILKSIKIVKIKILVGT